MKTHFYLGQQVCNRFDHNDLGSVIATSDSGVSVRWHAGTLGCFALTDSCVPLPVAACVELKNNECWELRGDSWHMLGSDDYSPVAKEHFQSYSECCSLSRQTQIPVQPYSA